MEIGCVYSADDFADKLPNFSSIPFGISSVAAALKHAGHDPRLLVVTPPTNISDLIGGYIQEHNPRLMCLTAVSTQYPKICAIAKMIKEISPSTAVILGGHHATLNPEESIKFPPFDAICIGEGERAVVEYAAGIQKDERPGGINNLWIKTGRDPVEKNPQDPFIQDLDSLPPIDMRLWDEWIQDKTALASVLVGRGCPNRCAYCSNHALARVAKGKYVRFRSVESVVEEIGRLIELYPDLSRVFLEMETFSVKLDYTFKMCEALEKFNANRDKPIFFGANLAVTRQLGNNHELMKWFKRANFNFFNIGLESGSEKVRNEILRRPAYTNQEFLDFCRLAKSYGITFNLFALLGIPGETVDDFQETIKIIRLSEPQNVLLSIFYPYPGTDLHARVKQMGIWTDDLPDPSMERSRALMDLPGFPKKRIQREFLLFPYKAYKGKKSLAIIAAMMATRYISISPILKPIYMKALTNNYFNALRNRFSTSKS